MKTLKIFLVLFPLLLFSTETALGQTDIPVKTLKGHRWYVRSVAFSPDAKYLASASSDRTVKLWEVSTGQLLKTLKGHADEVFSIAFSPDGEYLVSGSKDHTIKLWEVTTGQLVQTLKGHTSIVYSVTFSPDGRYLVSGSGDNAIKLWEVPSGELLKTLEGHTHWVLCVSFSPDGKLSASGSCDSTIKLWEVSSGELLKTLEGHTYWVLCVSFSPDGKLLASGSWDNTIKLWEVSSGELLKTLKGHTADVQSLSFSPDGRYLASGSVDSTIKLWEVSSGEVLETLEGHTSYVLSVSFSPDGRFLASGSCDSTIKLWEMDIVPPKPKYPPILAGVVSFSEPSGNDLVDPSETAVLLLSLSNNGKGDAYGIQVHVRPEREVAGLNYRKTYWVRRLAAAHSIQLKIPVTADADVSPQEALFIISVTEANAFDLQPPLRIRFSTGGPPRADLKLLNYDMDDFNRNSMLEPLEVANITARVQNRGDEEARKAKVVLSVGENVFFAAESKSAFDLGNLLPGQYKDIEFTIFTNSRATSVSISFDLTESSGQYGRTEKIELPFNVAQETPQEPVDTTVKLTPEIIEDIAPLAKLPSLPNVDIDIPQCKLSNPDAVAVVIGNKNYEHPDAYPAEFATNDAFLFRKYLVETFGLRRGNIIFETDVSLAAFNAIFGTKDNPKGKLYRHVKPDKSDVYIYYSGHGAPDPDTKVGYFLPVDCDPSVVALNGYSLDTFYDNLKKLPARSVTVIIDACFSGVSEGGSLLKGISPVFIEAKQGAGLPNGIIFTSAEKDQVSTWYEEKRHSLFTYFFLSGLRGLADINEDGTITVGEMADFLGDPGEGVPYWAGRLKNREQTPTVFGDPNRVLTKY